MVTRLTLVFIYWHSISLNQQTQYPLGVAREYRFLGFNPKGSLGELTSFSSAPTMGSKRHFSSFHSSDGVLSVTNTRQKSINSTIKQARSIHHCPCTKNTPKSRIRVKNPSTQHKNLQKPLKIRPFSHFSVAASMRIHYILQRQPVRLYRSRCADVMRAVQKGK
jgi:hypothetical protein